MKLTVFYYFMRFGSQGLDEATEYVLDPSKPIRREIDRVFRAVRLRLEHPHNAPRSHAIVNYSGASIGKVTWVRTRHGYGLKVAKYKNMIAMHFPGYAE